MAKRDVKIKDLFLISWRKLWIIVVAGFVSILLHNAVYALFNVEDAFFFILVIFVIPIYFLVMVIYSVIYKIMKRARVVGVDGATSFGDKLFKG